MVSGFLLVVVLARVLPKADYALYSQAFLVVATLTPLLSMGLSEGLYYWLQKPGHRGRVFGDATLLLGLVGFVFLLGVFVWTDLRTFLFKDSFASSNLNWLLGFPVLVSLLLSLVPPVFLSFRLYRRLAIFHLVGRTALFASVVIFALVFGSFQAVWIGLALGLSAQYFLGLMILPFNLLHGRGKVASWKTQLIYGSPLWLSAIFGNLQVQADRWFVSVWGTPGDLADYTVALSVVTFLGSLTSPLNRVLTVDLTQLFLARETHRVARLFWRVLSINLSIFAPLVLILYFFAGDLVPLLFSGDYLASVPAFQLALFLLPARAVSFSSFEIAGGQSKVVALIFGANVLLMCILSYYLFPKWGYAAVLVSNILVTYFFSIPAHIVAFLKVLRVPLFTAKASVS